MIHEKLTVVYLFGVLLNEFTIETLSEAVGETLKWVCKTE